MGGEHLPVSNYDSLSIEELKEKLTHLYSYTDGALDLAAIREYEKSGENREGVLALLDKLEKQGVTKDAESAESTEEGAEDNPDESQQAGTKPSRESAAKAKQKD